MTDGSSGAGLRPARLLAARTLALLFAAATLLIAANVRLYLKDGNYQLVSEYKVEGDRVKFYSVERSQWEEVPLDLVDLKKTEAEVSAREASEKEETKEAAADDRVERDLKRQVESVPMDAGVYYVNGSSVEPVKQAESTLVQSKKRKALQVITPVPVVSGKGVVELEGEHSKTVVHSATPEFYIRLSSPERFGIVKVTPNKGKRIVEKVTTIQVSNEKGEDRDAVDVYRYQVGDDFYKIWPLKPLAPGEYAVVQYAEGEVDIQIWDFSWPGKG
jgi:hypothetical protein